MCVSLRPDWEKAHFRRGMALEDKGEDNDALAAFEAAHSTATGANNPEIAKKIKHLKAKVRPSSIHVPKTKPVAPSKADPSDKGGPKGDPEWLVTAKSPGQPIHVRIGASSCSPWGPRTSVKGTSARTGAFQYLANTSPKYVICR